MQSAACVICNELEQQEKRRFFAVFFLFSSLNHQYSKLFLKIFDMGIVFWRLLMYNIASTKKS